MRIRRVVAVSVAALVLAPTVAAAGGRAGGFARRGPVVQGGGFKSHGLAHQRPSVFPIPRNPWKSWGVTRPSPGHHGHHFNHGTHFNGSHFNHVTPFVSPWAFPSGGSTIVTVAPSPNLVIYQPEAPVVAQAPVAAVPPAPMETVVEYATGRYELRGDGITTPYVWVWIPRPPAGPPPPPAQAPPAQAPPAEPPASSSGSGGDRSARVGDVYRWTDENGVTTWTDRLSRVPERFRSQAQSDAGRK